MDNDRQQPTGAELASNAISGIGYTLRKGLDRMGFEADKMMRTNRVRAEAARLAKQIEKRREDIVDRVLELEAAGAEMEPSLQAIVDEVRSLQTQVAAKNSEVETIATEAWVEPPPPPPPPAPVHPLQPAQPTAPAAPKALPQGTQKPRATSSRPKAPVVTGEVVQRDAKQHPEYCPRCGAALRPVSAFCPSCGLKL